MLFRSLDARELPPAALLSADTKHPAIAAAVDLFDRADGVVVATPVYKASYSGLLKTLLDLLPQRALADKVVLPLATGGTLAHVLVLDYALRPVLSALGSSDIVQGYFLLDQAVTVAEGEATFADDAQDGLRRALDRFTRSLDNRAVGIPADAVLASGAGSVTGTVTAGLAVASVRLPAAA